MITKEQAIQELRRREALAELQRRSVMTEPNFTDETLVGQLKGRLPETEPSFMGKTAPSPFKQEYMKDLQQRQSALDELNRRGFDEEQVKTILATEKITKRLPIGRTIGGIAGGAMGPTILGQIPPFTFLPEEAITIPLTAAIGAGAGGAGGQAAQIALQQKRMAGIGELFKAGGAEALYEIGGRYGMMGAKLAFSPFIKNTVPEAAEIIRKYGANAIEFSPAELDKRLTIKAMESISRGSFGTQDMWREFAEKQLTGIKGIADQLADSMVEGAVRQSPDAVGKMFAEGISEPGGTVLRWMDDLFNPLYKQVDDLTKTAIVKTKPLKNLALKELAIDSRMIKEGKRGLYLTPQGRQLLNQILNLQDEIQFGDMRMLRTRFLEASRKLARDLDSSKTIAKRVANKANEALFEPVNVTGLTPEARRLLENTNKLYKAAQEGLEKTFPEKMAKAIAQNPAKFGKYIFPENNPEAILLIKKSLIEPVSGMKSEEGRLLWNQLRQAWYTNLLERSNKESGMSSVAYYNTLKKMGKSLDVMFSPAEKEGIENINKIFKVIKVGSSAGTPLFTKGIQITGGYMMYQGIEEGDVMKIMRGGALALGPVAFARLAMNPKGRKLLTAGFTTKKLSSSQMAPIAARMVNLLKEMDAEERKKTTKILKDKQQKKWRKSMPPGRQLRGFGGRGF